MARVTTRRNPPMSPRAMGGATPVTFIQETISELRKSVWPSREETARLTAIVIALSLAMALFLGGLDRLLDVVFGHFIL